MNWKSFFVQLWRVFILQSWNWTTDGVPDKLKLYTRIHRFSSFARRRTSGGRYQLCVILFILLHTLRLCLSCVYVTGGNQYEKWLWADIGMAFGQAYRVIFNINVAYGFLICSLVMTCNYYVTQRLKSRPWYTCWTTFLKRKGKLPNLCGLYTEADQVLLWKTAFCSQLFGICLGCEVALFVSLFTTYTLLVDFPFDRPLDEIYPIFLLNLCWIICYALAVVYAFLCMIPIATAFICEVLFYTIRVCNIMRQLTSNPQNLGHIADVMKDMEIIRRQFISKRPLLNILLGIYMLGAITCGLL